MSLVMKHSADLGTFLVSSPETPLTASLGIRALPDGNGRAGRVPGGDVEDFTQVRAVPIAARVLRRQELGANAENLAGGMGGNCDESAVEDFFLCEPSRQEHDVGVRP